MKKRESFMFLIELMISILIFFMTAAICLLIFSKAHGMTRSSRELDAAAQAEENIAEIVSGADNILDAENLIKGAYPNAACSNVRKEDSGDADGEGVSVGQEGRSDGELLNVSVPFDADLKPTSERGAYLLTAEIRVDSGMIHTDMHFYPVDSKGSDIGDSVYDLATRNVISDAEDREVS